MHSHMRGAKRHRGRKNSHVALMTSATRYAEKDSYSMNDDSGRYTHHKNNLGKKKRRRGRGLLYTTFRADPAPWDASPPRTPPSSVSAEEHEFGMLFCCYVAMFVLTKEKNKTKQK